MKRVRRLFLVLVAGLALIELAWIGAFSWAQRTGRLERWTERRPDRFVLEYATARSLLPFHVRLTDVRIAGQTARWQWGVAADEVNAAISPWPLLDRRLVFHTVVGSGVNVAARRRATSAEEAAELADLLPPIPEYPFHSETPDRPPSAKPPWSFEFPNLSAVDVREVWIEQLRFRGNLAANGGFAFRRRTEAEVFRSSVRIGSGSAELSGKPLADQLSATLAVRLDPLEYKVQRGRAALPFLNLQGKAQGSFSEAELLRRYLAKVRWLEFDDFPAKFVAAAKVERGVVQPGSRLTATRPYRAVRVFGFEIAGASALEFAVTTDAQGPRGDLELLYEMFDIRLQPPSQPDILGEGLRIGLATRELRLGELPDDGRVQLELGKAKIIDLSTFQTLLPAAAEVRLLGGTGRIEGRLEADLATGKAEGRVQAKIARAEMSYRKLGLEGEIELDVPLRSEDVTARRFDLGGSRFGVRSFRVRGAEAAPAPEEGWWATASFPRGHISLAAPVGIETAIELAMRDTAPLLAIYAEKKDLPNWLERQILESDATATAQLLWRSGEIRLDRIETRLRETQVHARFGVTSGVRRAQLLLEWKKLAFGVELDGARRDFHLVKAREWFRGEQP